MGYACPVCDAPQADAEHLANHLAFTALLHGGSHEEWLDEHAPGWEDAGPDDLAARVVDLADETEYDAVFEDTTDAHGHARDHGLPPEAAPARPWMDGEAGRPDGETARIVDEARELTERMRDERDGRSVSQDE